MNQPPTVGQAGPSGPPEGAQVPGLFTVVQVAHIAQIVAIGPAFVLSGPSGPPEGAQVPGLFKAVYVAQIAQIVAIATRQQSQPTQPPREVIEELGRSIERVQKLGAKPYDDSGDSEATWLWLDRVNKVYGVMGYTDEQRVLFSTFLMEQGQRL